MAKDSSGPRPVTHDPNRPEDEWIETYSHRQFFFSRPWESEVRLEDIARALSMQCRYNGHVDRFYSVAEHSVLLCDYVHKTVNARDGGAMRKQMALHALLHDAAEAYTSDIPRPFKNRLPIIRELEHEIDAAVLGHFGLPAEKPAWLKELDTRIVRDEKTQAKCSSDRRWWHDGLEPLGVQLHFWTPAMAEVQFLGRYYRLTDAVHKGRSLP